MSLTFDEDLGRSEKKDDDHKGKHMKNKKRKNSSEQIQPVISDKKRSKHELLSKTREEVFATKSCDSLAILHPEIYVTHIINVMCR